MAKWVGEGKPYTGTIDDLTIYQLPDGNWYVRMKSSITGKRIKKDPVFAGFRKSSFRMKDASPIASKVYQQLPGKKYALFREMTGKALLWLKAGLTVEEITNKLMNEYIQVNKTPVVKRVRVQSIPSFKKTLLPQLKKNIGHPIKRQHPKRTLLYAYSHLKPG